jgi:hypothetical protein
MDVYAPPSGAGQTRWHNQWTCVDREQPRRNVGSICSVQSEQGRDLAIICQASKPTVIPLPLTSGKYLGNGSITGYGKIFSGLRMMIG